MLTAQKDLYLDQSYTKLANLNTKNNNQIVKRDFVILGGGLAIIAGMIFFLYYRKNQKQKVRKFKMILKNHKQAREFNQPIQNEIASTTQMKADKVNRNLNIEKDNPIISAEVEERILNQLNKFEKTKLFTSNSFALSDLVSYCQTNTKYLSYCINHHKKMDFNNYINELRIQFIIDKLLKEPIYRKYKFSTLAEEAGFSSQNKFSTVFKKSTSITPSEFIKQLELTPKSKQF